ncbi:MAG: MBL fold metallo-hydrolase [Syntrophobacteraceae bacterium]|nr:MBL fold metallo-hydrolase [Syntrophobacteraceae bacterium]
MKKPATIEMIEVPVPFSPGTTNCYFIPGSTPTLIDPGVYSPEAFKRLQSGLRELGADIADIERIILTHGHADHAGLAGAVAALGRAAVFVHRREEERMLVWSEKVRKQKAEGFHDFFGQAGVSQNIAAKATRVLLDRFRRNFSPISEMVFLQGGELLSFDQFELRVLHTPGHTAGSICLFDDSQGLLFAGDSLHAKIVPYISTECEAPVGEPAYFALEQYLETLEVLGALPARCALPGHGPRSLRPGELIGRLKRNRARRRQRIVEILQSGTPWMSQFAILERMFLGAAAAGVLYMGISEVRGCLEVMEKEGLVAAVVDGGPKLYRLNGQNPARQEAN